MIEYLSLIDYLLYKNDKENILLIDILVNKGFLYNVFVL